ncbi:DUF2262 domain-containing protein [Novipirellula sp. SH528]|uniref:DUF2262 domain-containing protein n=1 Tax=Novipirellula sp. SH528 TaxID=3454466 RepID=UPI003FA135F4
MRKSIRSAALGQLTYNEQFRHYGTQIVHNDATIEVTLNVDTDDGIDKMLPLAAQVWKGRSRHIKAFRDYATTQLIDELNEFLVADDERSEPISQKQLQRILRVPFSVTFNFERHSSDNVEFCVAGGTAECLREHCLYVFFAANGTIKGGEVVRLF